MRQTSRHPPRRIARRILPDGFTLTLLITVLFASLFPSRGAAAMALEGLSRIGIFLLFFLHGSKLSREAVLDGLSHWRLHLVVLLSTFALFPLLGLALLPVSKLLLSPELTKGVLLLCTLPSTVQSSVALTAVARGNVPAAIYAASASSLFGILLTPLLVGLILGGWESGLISLDAIGEVLVMLLLPFAAGQVAQRWIGGWVRRHPGLVGLVDRGAVLLVIYTAMSSSVLEGFWRALPLPSLLALLLVCALLLFLALFTTRAASRGLGFDQADEIAIMFSGSKKSLITGAPMVKVFFAGQSLAPLLLPLLLYHQLQLMVCAVIAQRLARRETSPPR